jgi:hypothetical protein
MWPDGGAMFLVLYKRKFILSNAGKLAAEEFYVVSGTPLRQATSKGKPSKYITCKYNPVRMRHDPNHNARVTELLDNLQSVEDFITSGAILPGRTTENRWNKVEEGENTRST